MKTEINVDILLATHHISPLKQWDIAVIVKSSPRSWSTWNLLVPVVRTPVDATTNATTPVGRNLPDPASHIARPMSLHWEATCKAWWKKCWSDCLKLWSTISKIVTAKSKLHILNQNPPWLRILPFADSTLFWGILSHPVWIDCVPRILPSPTWNGNRRTWPLQGALPCFIVHLWRTPRILKYSKANPSDLPDLLGIGSKNPSLRKKKTTQTRRVCKTFTRSASPLIATINNKWIAHVDGIRPTSVPL